MHFFCWCLTVIAPKQNMYSSLGPPTLSMASSKRYSFFIMMFASKYFEQTDGFFWVFCWEFFGWNSDRKSSNSSSFTKNLGPGGSRDRDLLQAGENWKMFVMLVQIGTCTWFMTCPDDHWKVHNAFFGITNHSWCIQCLSWTTYIWQIVDCSSTYSGLLQ